MRKYNLINKRFGKLIAISPINTNYGRQGWLCKCDCGGVSKVITNHLLSGHTRSCRSCQGRTHNDTTNPLYWVHHRIVNSYCGCCKKWRRYEVFKKWALINGWEKGLWIHRKADKGIYTPKNCFVGIRRLQALYGKSRYARLLPGDIPKIKTLYSSGLTQKEVGKLFDVSQITVSRIVRGVTWKD